MKTGKGAYRQRNARVICIMSLQYKIIYTQEEAQRNRQILMGNCNKKDQNQTITNFEEERWKLFATCIHPSCGILENIYHPNLRLMKWLGSPCSHSESTGWPEGATAVYLPAVYEVGQTRRYVGDIFDQNQKGQPVTGVQKKQYLITEQLVRVKDIKLTQEEVIIVLHEALAGYQALLAQFGGFVARDDMVFIARDGFVKLWVNENLAEGEPQFPHPYISEQEFISSLIRQICTRTAGLESLMQHLLSQNVNFPRIQDCLRALIYMRRSKLRVDMDKNQFDEIVKAYKIDDSSPMKKSRARSSMIWNGTGSARHRKNSQQLQFIVGEELNPNSHKKIAYVRDYSRVRLPFHQETPQASRYQANLRQSKSSKNLRSGIMEVQSKVVYGNGNGNGYRGQNSFAQ